MYTPLTNDQWRKIEAVFDFNYRRTRKHEPREIVEAIRYQHETGTPWRLLPADKFPPYQTVFYYFRKWGGQHFVDRVDFALNDQPESITRRSVAGRIADLAEKIQKDNAPASILLHRISSLVVLERDDDLRGILDGLDLSLQN